MDVPELRRYSRGRTRLRPSPVAAAQCQPAIVARVAVVSVPGAVGQSGNQANQDKPDGGHAGADDADVDLDSRPEGDANLVPGWVGGIREGDEGLQTEDTHDCNTGTVSDVRSVVRSS